MEKNPGDRYPSTRSSRSFILLVGGCLSFAVAVGAYYLFREPSLEGGSQESGDNGDDDLRGQIQDLSRQVRMLKADQRASKVKLIEVANRTEDIDKGGNEEDLRPEQMSPEEEMAQVQKRYDFLDEAFLAEERDPSWSADTEGEIATAFRTESLADAALQSASCASSMCKIEVLLTKDLAYMDFELTFTQALQQFLPRGTIRNIEQEDGTTWVTSYLARPTAHLPRWEPETE